MYVQSLSVDMQGRQSVNYVAVPQQNVTVLTAPNTLQGHTMYSTGGLQPTTNGAFTVPYIVCGSPELAGAQFAAAPPPQQQQQQVVYLLAQQPPHQTMFVSAANASPARSISFASANTFDRGMEQPRHVLLVEDHSHGQSLRQEASESGYSAAGSVNMDSICRHYLSGRCNRRKCRFRHCREGEAMFAPANFSAVSSGSFTATGTAAPASMTAAAPLPNAGSYLNAPTPPTVNHTGRNTPMGNVSKSFSATTTVIPAANYEGAAVAPSMIRTAVDPPMFNSNINYTPSPRGSIPSQSTHSWQSSSAFIA